MNKKPFCSIIIPTKNPDKIFFLDCIESIIKQSMNNYELIIVANNCNNYSIALIEDLVSKISNCRLIITDDVGVSRARNRGIEEAAGDYIVFVDDDDMLSPFFLKLIDHSDFTVFQYTNNINTFDTQSVPRKILLEKENIHNLFFKGKNPYGLETRSVWGKAFLLSIIKENNIRFCDKLYNGEDTCFVLEYASRCKSLTFYDGGYGYYYRMRGNSVTYRYNEDIINQFDIYYEEYKRILDENNIDIQILHFVLINQIIYNVFISHLFNKSNNLSLIEKAKQLKKFVDKRQYKEALQTVKIKEIPTTKKKIITFMLKNHLYFIASVLLNWRYSK